VAVSAVSIRLNEYCDVVSCLLVADVFLAWVFSAVWDVVGVSSVAYAEAVEVLVFEPAAVAAAFIVVHLTLF
jgi:membrane-anchored glycerophosphoryl diester phosphodiesterase (GDPDase)